MFSDQVYLVVMCSPSAENKRRSKHAGKSLNPEWNQTVIYKNIHLEQVLDSVRDTLQVHSDMLAHVGRDVLSEKQHWEPTPGP